MLAVTATLMAIAIPARAQDPSAPGIDVHIRMNGMTEQYGPGPTPLSFVVGRLRVRYELSANGSGLLASQRLSYPAQAIDEAFTPGRGPRGFTIVKSRDGQLQLHVWAEELQRETVIAARFVKGDWTALAAGRPVVIAASVDGLRRVHGVVDQVGKAVTTVLRQRFENAIPFVTVRIGDLVLKKLDLSGRDIVFDGSSRGVTVTYPSGEISYNAPVSVGG